MKLRINGNSLRLRVSRSELSRFQLGERIEETIHFAPAPEAKLTYALEFALQSEPANVRYESNVVTVVLSEARARTWGLNGEVGVYETLGIESAGSLDVIVEKDFACADGSEAENSDTFPNPRVGVTC